MAEEKFRLANEAFVDENYEEACKLYTEAIDGDNSKAEYYSSRSQTQLKLLNYQDALQDAISALNISPNNAKSHLRKGTALFHLKQFGEAREAFVTGQAIQGADKSFENWIGKCDTEIKTTSSQESSGGSDMATASSTVPGASGGSASSAAASDPVPMKPSARAKYDWYQTETHVIVTIMVKGLKQEDLSVDILEHSLSVTAKLPSGSDYSLELDLARKVVPAESRTKLMSTKVEIKLKKAEGYHWTKLEGDSSNEAKQFNPAASKADSTSKYPSSSHYTRDWDKLVVEIKEEEKNEKPEGDAALNALFQQIYRDGSDEVKKAMNKSFSESGGTVLSTNWKDISKAKTEVKPPDGMEHKSY